MVDEAMVLEQRTTQGSAPQATAFCISRWIAPIQDQYSTCSLVVCLDGICGDKLGYRQWLPAEDSGLSEVIDWKISGDSDRTGGCCCWS